MKMKVSGEWQGKTEVGQSTWAAHTPKQQSEARRVSEQAGSVTTWGVSDLTSAFPAWSSQHNPVSEHLHCLNFILWCCLLIGQTWLTASELQSDRQGASRPTAQNSQSEGERELHAGYMKLRPPDVCSRAWGLSRGGRA